VWQAAHAGLTSTTSLYTNSQPYPQVYFYDDQRVSDEEDSPVYSVVVRFVDSFGSDMLVGEGIPTMPPANWESAFVFILENGTIILTAQLLPEDLSHMSLPEHVAKRQELEAEVTGLEQQVDQLVGTGFAAWKYQATVTSVVPGYGLDGVIQTGDVISGYRILRTDLEDEDPAFGQALYHNTVVDSETTVVRNGTSVWHAAHAGLTSTLSLCPVWTYPPQQLHSYDDQKVSDEENSTVYSVLVRFLDFSGLEMLVDERIPTMPPANWESAFVYIRVNGVTVVTAQLLAGDLSHMFLPEHVGKRQELEAEIAGLQQDVASLESEVSALEQQLAAASQAIAAKQAQIDSLTASLEAANADTAAKQAQIDTLAADIAAANADIAAKQAQIDALTADLAAANADIVAKQAQIDALTADLAAANADIVAKQAQIDVLTAEKAALQQQLDAANADIVAKQAQIDALTADLAAANADIAAKQAQIDVLLVEKAALQQQLDAANADIAAKQGQIDDLLAEKVALQQQLAAANADIAALTTALQQADADIAALQQNVAELEADNAAYDAQVTAVSGSMATLGSTLAAQFNNPSFVMPGNTPEEQAENLKAALLSLNPGQRQAVFLSLGGVKNGN
jgi:septal ring factor EnvC (AmiA/AmiB activator)